MRNTDSIRDQLRRNAVAIISLVVALSSLGYNTWRNEQTEVNRNVRHAAFEMLVRLGELQQVADHLHYGNDPQRGSPITGWGYVAVIRDLAMVMPRPVQDNADALFMSWDKRWDELGESESAVKEISESIKLTRTNVIDVLESLR